jgi:dipeptidyl aminopeptidase/acylaminoacyl peptidase
MIAISATYHQDFRNRRTDIYLIQSNDIEISCLTDTLPSSSYKKLQWLGQQNILFQSYSAAHPTARYATINLATRIVQPLLPELNPQLITAITVDGFIVIPTQYHYLMLPVNRTVDEHIELAIDGLLVSISPDGQWLAIYQEETPEYIYIQELNTTHVQRILMFDSVNEHYGESETVIWSPNSKYLAYIAEYTELWVMHADGTQRRKIGNLNYFWRDFRWSPDSRSIAFIGDAPDDQGGGPSVSQAPLCITSIDDAAPRQLATLYQQDESGGVWDWLEDASHIVYATHEASEPNLYTINIHNYMKQRIAATEQFAAIYDVAASR